MTVVMSLTKYFNYMLTQNQGNPKGIIRGLKALVKHSFNNHTLCDRRWCKFLQKKAEKFANLPRGKPLQSLSLQVALEKIFVQDMVPHAESLASLSSSQPNESQNMGLVRKAHKFNHYSESSSLSYRFASSVCQKNEGYGYLASIHKELGLPSGYSMEKRASCLDKDRDRKLAISKTVEFKRRRLVLKLERSGADRSSELREGDTYQSEIALVEEEDTEEIPDIVDDLVPIPEITTEVVFDLETTGLKRTSEILQVAAKCKTDIFATYALPYGLITSGATEKNGISKIGNQLFQKLEPANPSSPTQLVNSVSQKRALELFTEFLDKHKPVVLIGHNIAAFDMYVLYNNMQRYGLWSSFCSKLQGFVDTNTVSKPIVKKTEPTSQEFLVKRFLGYSYNAHNAVDDVNALHDLWLKVKPEVMKKYGVNMVSSPEVINDWKPKQNSLAEIIQSKALSESMATKIAKSGLNINHLKAAIKRDGLDGLTLLLSAKRKSGKPRCTASKQVIQKLFEYLDK